MLQDTTLLIIESDAKHRQALKDYAAANHCPYKIIHTDSFAGAQKARQQNGVHLIVSNFSIGQRNVIQFLPHAGKVPVIILDSAEKSEAMIEALKAGASAHIIKEDSFTYIKWLFISIEKHLDLFKLQEIAINSCLDERQYKGIVQNIPDIIYRVDPDGYFTFLNKSVRTLGYEPSELIGKHFKRIIHPEDFESVCRQVYLSKMDDGELPGADRPLFFDERRSGFRRTMGLEVRLVAKQWVADPKDVNVIIGSVISFGEISAQGEYAEAERFLGTVGIIHDITNRKKSEALLRKLYQAVDQSPISVIITDADGLIEYVNPHFFRSSGYPPHEIVGRHIKILKQADGTHDFDFDRISETTSIWQGELRSRKKNGEESWENVSVTPIMDPSNNITNYLIVKNDITEQKRAYKILKEAQEDLDLVVKERTTELLNVNRDLRREISERKKMEAERHKLETRLMQAHKLEIIGTLSGGIAHDFNNILSPILGLAEVTLLDLPEDSPLKNNLGQIIDAAQRAKALVQQILSFGRRNDNDKSRVQVGPIIKEVLKLIRATLPAGIEIKFDAAKDYPAIVINPNHIHQILMNLCANASQAMEEKGGVLHVELKALTVKEPDEQPGVRLKPGKYVLIKVTDTGTGMGEEVLNKVFEPFYTTRKDHQGTGLGLSVVHSIVSNNNGEIKVASKIGQGTSVSVYFPAAGGPKAPEEPAAPAEKISKGNENVLFVDDEKSIQLMGQMMLEKLGYGVTVCADGEEALAYIRARRNEIDLVLTDLAMPKIDGFNLCRQLQSEFPDLPLVLTTGYDQNITEEKCREAGIKELLLKPFSLQKLSRTIRLALTK